MRGKLRIDEHDHSSESNQDTKVVERARPLGRHHPEDQHRSPKGGRGVEDAGKAAADVLLAPSDGDPGHDGVRHGHERERTEAVAPSRAEEGPAAKSDDQSQREKTRERAKKKEDLRAHVADHDLDGEKRTTPDERERDQSRVRKQAASGLRHGSATHRSTGPA